MSSCEDRSKSAFLCWFAWYFSYQYLVMTPLNYIFNVAINYKCCRQIKTVFRGCGYDIRPYKWRHKARFSKWIDFAELNGSPSVSVGFQMFSINNIGVPLSRIQWFCMLRYLTHISNSLKYSMINHWINWTFINEFVSYHKFK